MGISHATNFRYSRSLAVLSLALGAASFSGGVARAGTIYVANYNAGTIGEYDTSGAVINASLITGLNTPVGITIVGSDLFVTSSGTPVGGSYAGTGTVGEYTTSGATVNANLVTGLTFPDGIAAVGSDLFIAANGAIGEYSLSGATVNANLIAIGDPKGLAVIGSDLFVADPDGTVGEYTTSGATVNASLITFSQQSWGIATDGTNLFVALPAVGTVGEYTTSGATINASLITGLDAPNGMAIDGSDLFVSSYPYAPIGEYTTSGATVNASLITDFGGPYGIAITDTSSTTPEPATYLMFSVGIALICIRRASDKKKSLQLLDARSAVIAPVAYFPGRIDPRAGLVAVFHRPILTLIFDTRQPLCLQVWQRCVNTYQFCNISTPGTLPNVSLFGGGWQQHPMIEPSRKGPTPLKTVQ